MNGIDSFTEIIEKKFSNVKGHIIKNMLKRLMQNKENELEKTNKKQLLVI